MKLHNRKKPTNNIHSNGFTLIELMVVVAVIAILASIAYPSYLQHMFEARRSDATSSLMEMANRLELFYSNNNTYTTDATNLGYGSTTPGSHEGYYTLSIPTGNATTFTIQASIVAGGAQAGDACGTFTLDNTGQQGVSGGSLSAAQCW